MSKKMLKKNKLTGNATVKLIAEVKEHPCLWSSTDPSYHDRYALNKTWDEISTKMSLPADFLKVKWKNLRDVYIKILKKCKSPEAYRGTWRHFEQLKFLCRPCDAESEDSDETIAFETLYDDESPLSSEVSVKIEPDVTVRQSLEDDPIVPVPEKRRKLEDTTDDDGDYDLMFLKSLAPYFKKLDSMRKLVVRSKMQDMLMNEIAAQRSEGFKRLMGDV